MAEPYVDRPNVIARYKEKKFGRQYMLFGKDCDVDAASRSSGRTMFDGDLLIQGDLLVSGAETSSRRNGLIDRKTRWITRFSH